MAIFTTGQAGGQAIQPTSVPAAYTTDAQDLARSQRLAQMLTAAPMPEGQMISGRYVAPSITQNLAQFANMATGAYFADKAEKQNQALAEKLRTGETQALADFMKTKQGTPAEMFAAQAGPMLDGGNIPIQQSRAAVAPNPQAAYANLYQDPRSPQRLRDLAFTKMMADPEAFTLAEGATRVEKQPDGTYKTVATGAEKSSPEYRNYLIAKNDPINPFKGGFTDYQVSLKRAGAPSVSVSTANKFAGGFADKAATRVDAMYDAALNAPQAIENAKRTIELVNSGALTGPTADVALTAAKIFNVAGANNQDTISKTEQLFSNRGKAMLGSIKASGLAGSQGLTEGERKFLTQAEGGTITLNADTLKAMAGLVIKLAVANQKKWNAQAAKMDKEILNATGAGPVEVYTGIGTIDENNPLLKPKR
jgi:hypothetical protein